MYCIPLCCCDTEYATNHNNRYKLLGRNTTSITTEVNGVKRQVTVIAVNKFDSDRKRMSVIIKEDNGTIRLLCKVCAVYMHRNNTSMTYCACCANVC
jgi:magnesium-transporting ATPase (P-type)